jgi:hypothetical protein
MQNEECSFPCARRSGYCAASSAPPHGDAGRGARPTTSRRRLNWSWRPSSVN